MALSSSHPAPWYLSDFSNLSPFRSAAMKDFYKYSQDLVLSESPLSPWQMSPDIHQSDCLCSVLHSERQTLGCTLVHIMSRRSHHIFIFIFYVLFWNEFIKDFTLTVNTAAIGMAAFMKTERRTQNHRELRSLFEDLINIISSMFPNILVINRHWYLLLEAFFVIFFFITFHV